MRWRLLGGLSAVTLVLGANYAAIVSVLLPAQVASIDPVGKVGSLALVVSVSAALAIFAQPVLGAISDRSTSRLGRRNLVMLVSAIVAGALLLGLGGASSIVQLVVLWSAAQFALNGVDIASSAYLVDRFSAQRRGRVAAALTLAILLGAAIGSILAGVFVSRIFQGYLLLGAALSAVVVGFVVLDRPRGLSSPLEASVSWAESLRALWDGIRTQRGFGWVMASRAAFMLGYQLIYAYLLYIGTDHLGLDEKGAAGLVGILTAVGAAGLAVGALVGGWASDRLGRRVPFLIAAGMLLASGLVLAIVVPGVPGMVAFAAVQGIGGGFFASCGLALVAQIVPGGESHGGRALGIYNIATNIPQVVAPVIGAALIATAGYGTLFLVAILAAIASSLIATRIREGSPG